jgi:DNA polymerase III subunit alpha
MKKQYASFHNHTHYSVGDGISKTNELYKAAVDKELSAIAITDHGNMNGIAEFFNSSEKNNFEVKHIFGNEVYFVPNLDDWKSEYDRLNDLTKDKELDKDELKKLKYFNNRYNHTVLLAQNQLGLENLFEITFLSHKYGYYRKPRIDKKVLERLNEGIIATTACIMGPISNLLLTCNDDYDQVYEEIEWWSSTFKDRYFLEMQFNEIEWQNDYNKILVKLSKEFKIPLIITTDTHYINKGQHKLQRILRLIDSKEMEEVTDEDLEKAIEDGNSDDFSCENLYVKSYDEIIESAKQYSPDIDIKIVEEALENTLSISDTIEVLKLDRSIKLPPFTNPETKQLYSEDECMSLLIDASKKALKEKGLHKKQEYVDRLKKEIITVKQNNLGTYFCIIYDIYKFGKQHQVAGPGRGSAAGSLMLYLLDVTTLDPITNDIMFERFLSPGRKEMPDIDMDWEYPDQIKDYMRSSYGEDNIAQVVSYGTFSYRNLLKDLGRIYGHSFDDMNKISGSVFKEVHNIYKLDEFSDQDKSTIVIDYDILLHYSPTFKKFVAENPEIGESFKILFGKIRHTGTHAAGVVSAEKLYRKMPLQSVAGEDGKRKIVTSYTEGVSSKTLGEFGFLKFDVLGLSTLRVFDHAYEMIAKRTNKTYQEVADAFHPSNLDVNDDNVYKHVFQDGNFCGIFQFTEKGIRSLAMRIQPDNFADVATIGALYRPGPMGSGMHTAYGENKKLAAQGKLKYEHPLEEKVLKETYSIITFQDQFMLLCKELGDFTWEEVNKFRKSVVKRSKAVDMTEIHKQWDDFKNKFITNSVVHGITEKHANELWERMMHHAGYSFNKSHTWSYGMLSYISAYLATHFPLEFYTSTLTYGGKDDFEKAVSEIRNINNIKIVPIDVNKSYDEFTIEDNSIRVPFYKVKGIGEKTATAIVEIRNKLGEFKDFDDFIEKTNGDIKKKDVELLIKIGAFDSITDKKQRKMLLNKWILYNTGKYEEYENGRYKKRPYSSNLEKLNEDLEEEDFEEYTVDELISFENDLYGFPMFISHWENKELTLLKEKIKKKMVHNDFNNEYFKDISFFDDANELLNSDENKGYTFSIIDSMNVRKDKKGNEMAFMVLKDISGYSFNVPIFSRQYKVLKDILSSNEMYITRLFVDEDKKELMLGAPGWNASENFISTFMIPIVVLKEIVNTL